MEAWAVDAETPQGALPLLLRRGAGGRIFRDALSLADEHRVLLAAWTTGVKVPRPYGYLGEVLGREAFVMERLNGETVGRRLVTRPEFAAALAHTCPCKWPRNWPAFTPSLRRPWTSCLAPGRPRPPARAGDARPAACVPGGAAPSLELALLTLRQRLPFDGPRVVCHGDFRVGNFMVGPQGLSAVLDWEFAHLGDPREDLGWTMVRAWRFRSDALRLGGIAEPEPFLARYRNHRSFGDTARSATLRVTRQRPVGSGCIESGTPPPLGRGTECRAGRAGAAGGRNRA